MSAAYDKIVAAVDGRGIHAVIAKATLEECQLALVTLARRGEYRNAIVRGLRARVNWLKLQPRTKAAIAMTGAAGRTTGRAAVLTAGKAGV